MFLSMHWLWQERQDTNTIATREGADCPKDFLKIAVCLWKRIIKWLLQMFPLLNSQVLNHLGFSLVLSTERNKSRPTAQSSGERR